LGGKFYFQLGWVRDFLRNKPQVFLLGLDLRELSVYLIYLFSFFTDVKIVWHGQGLFKHNKPGVIRSVFYRLLINKSVFYVAYNDLSRISLNSIKIDHSKILVADNTLVVEDVVCPVLKTGDELGVLFIGRLRGSSGLPNLIKAIAAVRSDTHYLLSLHIVGGGDEEDSFRRIYSEIDWIVWHGAQYNHDVIKSISLKCRFGCYPGNAGLSVVHFFGLSLPPIVHNKFNEHMGPEPYYVENLVNGFNFDGSFQGLKNVISLAFNMSVGDYKKMAKLSYDKYCDLNDPGLGVKFVEILNRIDA
jgi:glycosyltransferase involved in cell wall biosynthesis